MKQIKKILCLIMVLALAASLFTFTAAAEQTEKDPLNDPVVFVHGLFGWGERAKVNAVVPYWGMATGSLTDYFNGKGYETYSATVGPLSGCWDRACELYAQLTGTTVDYGIAHSAEKGHDRFGITYDKPLFEGWGADKKVNLVGHSFGGATTRMFLEILANGAPEEVAAAKAAGVEVSPFFEGGRGDWVHSLFEISAPHNGTTFIESCPMSTELVTGFIRDFAAALGLTDLKGIYDLQLEHFGFQMRDDENIVEAFARLMKSDFMEHNDNAIYDLTIDNALKINDRIEIQDDMYYFSVTGDKTNYSTVLKKQVVDPGMFVLLQPFGTRMCGYYDKTTVGGVYIDKSWLPNDGMVNVVSGLYPINSDLKCVKNGGSLGYVAYDGYSAYDFEAGVWNVLPCVPYDHLGAVGGFLTNSISATRLMYSQWLDMIYSTYSSGSTENPVNKKLPFIDVPENFWAYDYIKELYDLGVVNGKSETIFDPQGNVTRGQFVKMIGALDGVDVSKYTKCRFDDVNAGSAFAPYIEWAAENGIVLGYDEHTFAPGESISRQQIAVMLYRYAEYAGIQLGEKVQAIDFADFNDIGDYAKKAVVTLQMAGVISGFDNGDGTYSFQPYGNATRAQTCKLICTL